MKRLCVGGGVQRSIREAGRQAGRQRDRHRIDRNLLSDRTYVLRHSLMIFLITTWLPSSSSPKNSYDFEGKMAIVSLVLFVMSIFSPILLYISLVQGSGRNDQGT